MDGGQARVAVINVWEVVTFYPMFTAKPRGKFHIKVCRTLSCELVRLRRHPANGCRRNSASGWTRTRADGLFTISTVECLAPAAPGR